MCTEIIHIGILGPIVVKTSDIVTGQAAADVSNFAA